MPNIDTNAKPLTGFNSKVFGMDSSGTPGWIQASFFAPEVYSIGIPGTAGFGVGVAPELPDGMSPLPGTNSVLSPEFGNYQYSDGSICCFVPTYFYKYGTGSNGLSVNQVDIKPYSFFNSVAEANANGYTVHRAFYNGGVLRRGYFLDKWHNSANGTVASSLKNGIPISSATRGTLIGQDFASLGVAANYSGAIDLAKKRGPGWHCATLFQFTAVALAQLAHGQASTNSTYCGWYDPAGVTNFPKGYNNNAYKDHLDATVIYQPDGSGTTCGLTGSASIPSKVSHNGQECGVMDLNGLVYNIALGLTSDGTNYYILKPDVNISALTSGASLSTDVWGASSYAANYTNVGSSYGAMDNAAVNKIMGSANQVLSEDVSGLGWEMTGAGIPLLNGVGGSNMFGNDYFYPKLVSALCPVVGGRWNSTASAGCWALILDTSRANANFGVGLRSALYL